MENVSLKVLEKSLKFLFKKGYEPCRKDSGVSKNTSSTLFEKFITTIRFYTVIQNEENW